MKKNNVKQINYTINEIGQTYHQLAVLFHLSDSVSDILYVLEQEGGSCDQSLLYKQTMTSRKTVSSALIKMKDDGYLTIQKKNGRENKVALTEKGKDYLKETEAKITQAELRVYDTFSESDVREYLELNQRFLHGLRDELKKMKGEEK